MYTIKHGNKIVGSEIDLDKAVVKYLESMSTEPTVDTNQPGGPEAKAFVKKQIEQTGSFRWGKYLIKKD